MVCSYLKMDFEPPSKRLKRLRRPCPRCGQILSYSTYCRHLKLPVCPGTTVADSNESEGFFDSTFHNSETSQSEGSAEDEPYIDMHIQDDSFNDDVVSESDMLSTVSESSGPEVWSETESSDGDNTEENSRDTDANIQVQNMFCLCLTFIQLWYKISDRAIVCLLTVIGTVYLLLPLPMLC